MQDEVITEFFRMLKGSFRKILESLDDINLVGKFFANPFYDGYDSIPVQEVGMKDDVFHIEFTEYAETRVGGKRSKHFTYVEIGRGKESAVSVDNFLPVKKGKIHVHRFLTERPEKGKLEDRKISGLLFEPLISWGNPFACGHDSHLLGDAQVFSIETEEAED